jgi:altronate hydrolase
MHLRAKPQELVPTEAGAKPAGRDAELSLEGARKYLRARKAKGAGDILDRIVAVDECRPGASQSQLEIIAHRGKPGRRAQHGSQPVRAEPALPAQRREGQGRRKIVLHDAQHPPELAAIAEQAVDGSALRIDLVAYRRLNEAVRHALRQRRAMIAGDHVQHHVERGVATRAGHATAIEHYDLLLDGDLLVALVKHRHRLPMQGGGTVADEPGFGKREKAGIDCAEQRTMPVEPAQPIEHRSGHMLQRMISGNHDQNGQKPRLGDAAMYRHQHRIPGRHRLAVGRDESPVIEPPAAILVGEPQRLDRRHKRIKRKLGQQQKADLLRLPILLLLHVGTAVHATSPTTEKVKTRLKNVNTRGTSGATTGAARKAMECMTANRSPAIQLDANDDVAVALVDLHDGVATGVADVVVRELIPAGHKFALRDLAMGEVVRKFGLPIGRASGDVSRGRHVHCHNLAFAPDASGRIADVPAWQHAPAAASNKSFMGYRRADSSVGTRNYLGVVATVNCTATVARLIVESFRRRLAAAPVPGLDGVVALTHQHGCSVREDGPGMALLRRTIIGYLKHPNFAGVLLVGLGCEDNQIDELLSACGAAKPASVERLVVQETGGTRASIAAAVAKLERMLPDVEAARRVSVPASSLCLGLQCGGSDAFSALSANPALGLAVDRLVRAGGTAILSETPEIFGAESLLLSRAADADVEVRLQGLLEWWQHHAASDGGTLDANPSPGNRDGGITTIVEKSLGAVAKAGHAPLSGIYGYAERVDRAGLVFMDSPGFDPVSATGQIAAGANLIAFTTGRGSCFGAAPVPSFKLASNTDLYRRMADDIDLNCGTVIDGTAELDEVGEQIFARLLAVASGERTQSELLGYGEAEFAPWVPGAIY